VYIPYRQRALLAGGGVLAGPSPVGPRARARQSVTAQASPAVSNSQNALGSSTPVTGGTSVTLTQKSLGLTGVITPVKVVVLPSWQVPGAALKLRIPIELATPLLVKLVFWPMNRLLLAWSGLSAP
jgi:hypothetical protein